MTDHMDHGSTSNFIERPAARHNQTIRQAATARFLADPIEFAQNMGRILEQGLLDDLLIQDTPQQIDDLRQEFEYQIDNAIRREDIPAITACVTEYHEFMCYALTEAREYGVAMGAVMEQLRVGLTGVVDLSNRGLTFGDVQAHRDLQRLRRDHDLPFSSGYQETDYAKVKEEPTK